MEEEKLEREILEVVNDPEFWKEYMQKVRIEYLENCLINPEVKGERYLNVVKKMLNASQNPHPERNEED